MQRLKRKQQLLKESLGLTRDSVSQAQEMAGQAATFLSQQFGSVPMALLSSEILKMFVKLDSDKDGLLNSEEFASAFTLFRGKRLSAQEVNALMALVDVDGNGMVDQYEFDHLVRMQLQKPCNISCMVCRWDRSSPVRYKIFMFEKRSQTLSRCMYVHRAL
jgi:hypothetical protein